MRAILSRSIPIMAAAVLAITVTPAAMAAPVQVHDPVPITPNQLFSGYVNSSNAGPVTIKVACAVGAATGRPVGQQPVEVEPGPVSSPAQDHGNTGAKGISIVATLLTSTAGTSSSGHIATFASFYVTNSIPTTLKVPCSGSGIVTFTPKPKGTGAVTARLKVTFANIAG
ncbi:MAG TPA: hypothetical protein VGH27_32255 [Streptosporangiaceae bacterium]|jgi:hypothetical protein